MKRYIDIEAVVTTAGKPEPDAKVYVDVVKGAVVVGIEGWWGGWGVQDLETLRSVGASDWMVFGNYGKPVVCHNVAAIVAAASAPETPRGEATEKYWKALDAAKALMANGLDVTAAVARAANGGLLDGAETSFFSAWAAKKLEGATP